MDTPNKIYLTEEEIPKQWYNIRADMKVKPAPLISPATHQPLKFEELTPVFCDELVRQELDDTTPYIDIPDEVLGFYKMYRPSPVMRAYRLEKELGTPAKIYYKFEGNNTSGSHKLNSAIAQAYYAKKAGPQGRDHRNRRGPVGHGAEHGVRLCRARMQGVHGQVQLRAEDLPPRGDALLRRERDVLPEYSHQDRPEDPRRNTGYHRQPGLRDLGGRGSRRDAGRLPLCAWQRSGDRCSCTSP